jgi:hypothetical protein
MRRRLLDRLAEQLLILGRQFAEVKRPFDQLAVGTSIPRAITDVLFVVGAGQETE